MNELTFKKQKRAMKNLAEAIIKYVPKEYYEMPVKEFIQEMKKWLKDFKEAK